jgi:hypothetical protein
LAITLQPNGMSDQDARMIEVNNRRGVEKELGQLFVDRLALPLIGQNARFVEQLVDVRIAKARIV